MYRIFYSHLFEKKAKRFFKYHPEIKKQYYKTLQILKANPQHPSLRLHKLSGHLKDYYSVSINISYRIVLDLIITKKKIILVNIGSHDNVYE